MGLYTTTNDLMLQIRCPSPLRESTAESGGKAIAGPEREKLEASPAGEHAVSNGGQYAHGAGVRKGEEGDRGGEGKEEEGES